MNQRIESLLNELREAIHETLAESRNIAQIMAELEQERCCPAFSVDVFLPETSAADSTGPFSEALAFTKYDEDFLQAIKVTTWNMNEVLDRQR